MAGEVESQKDSVSGFVRKFDRSVVQHPCCTLCRMDILNRKHINVDQADSAEIRALGVVRVREALLENHLF